MVNNTKYMPILKYKPAEIGALSDLTEKQKDGLIPLFEFVVPPPLTEKEERDGITSEEKLMNKAISDPQDILIKWGDGRLFFVDFGLLYPENLCINFVNEFCFNATLLHLDYVPVINLTTDSMKYKEAILEIFVKNNLSKICIRINSFEIQNMKKVNEVLSQFMEEHRVDRKDISLLVDLKEHVSVDMYSIALRNIQDIMAITEYDVVILAGGAFPKDMSNYKIDAEDNHQIRNDWNGWLLHFKIALKRIPGFADYTIRHPIYDEKVIKRSSSATIKYTLHDRWNFYRGRVGEFEDCLAYANILRMLPEYQQFGSNFSKGDDYINEKGLYFEEYVKQRNEKPGQKIGGTGNATDWIRAGINHHIAVVVDQLASLPE